MQYHQSLSIQHSVTIWYRTPESCDTHKDGRTDAAILVLLFINLTRKVLCKLARTKVHLPMFIFEHVFFLKKGFATVCLFQKFRSLFLT